MRKVCIVAVLVAACNQQPNPKVEWPPMDGWDSFGQERCPSECRRLAELGCPEAQPTPGGISCSDSCQVLLGRRVWTPEDVVCVEQAKDVDGVRKCRVMC
jgi:hypothetical protein